MKRLIPILIVAALALTACVDHEEIPFSGTVIGIRECNSIVMEQNPGYMVKLEYPDSTGGTLNTNGGAIENVIVLYEPGERVMVNDHVHGTFYLDDKYSKANCSLHWPDLVLPEGVFWELIVD